MEFFWNTERPLTVMEVSQMMNQFNECYIHRLIKSLEKKEMLKVCGMQKSGKQYARQFIPTITREEYGVTLMENWGFKEKNRWQSFLPLWFGGQIVAKYKVPTS